MHRVHSQKLIHSTLNGLVESNRLVFSEQLLVETPLPHLRINGQHQANFLTQKTSF